MTEDNKTDSLREAYSVAFLVTGLTYLLTGTLIYWLETGFLNRILEAIQKLSFGEIFLLIGVFLFVAGILVLPPEKLEQGDRL